MIVIMKKGSHQTEESKHKSSLSHRGQVSGFKGKHHTATARQKNAVAHLGSRISAEGRRRIALGHLGKHHSLATRMKMSLAQRGEKHAMFGKHHREESKRKIALAMKGRPVPWLKGKHLSEEHKTKIKTSLLERNILPWNKGKKGYKLDLTPEDRRRRAENSVGKRMTDEIRGKIAISRLGQPSWNKGKTNIYSDATIAKIREARLKQKIPNKDTDIEIIVFGILDELGLDYDKHKSVTLCQADAVIPNKKACLFMDGCWWHGCPICKLKDAHYSKHDKDLKIRTELSKLGWKVVSIWEHEFKDINAIKQRLITELGL